MLDKLKHLFKKPTKKKEHGEAEVGPPIFLLLGSLTDVTKKDAYGYVRGLAERYVVTPQMGRIYVQEDKDNNRFLYEIHEGGPDRVILPSIMEALQEKSFVRLDLAGGGYVHIEDTSNELITLVYPNVKDATDLTTEPRPETEDILTYATSKSLIELFPEEKALPRVGLIILGMASIFFIGAVSTFTLHRSGILSPDVMLNTIQQGSTLSDQDNPILYMDKAQQEAKTKGMHLHALKKENNAWKWELLP